GFKPSKTLRVLSNWGVLISPGAPTNKKGVNALAFTPFLFVLYPEVRTPQFDKTRSVLDGLKPPRRGKAFG
ncbi:MAG: hypothetical protein Q7L07_14700, partial [Pseudohongiella sp.]|nr:hypothetical protein [Pseudohongiella sp.]